MAWSNFSFFLFFFHSFLFFNDFLFFNSFSFLLFFFSFYKNSDWLSSSHVKGIAAFPLHAILSSFLFILFFNLTKIIFIFLLFFLLLSPPGLQPRGSLTPRWLPRRIWQHPQRGPGLQNMLLWQNSRRRLWAWQRTRVMRAAPSSCPLKAWRRAGSHEDRPAKRARGPIIMSPALPPLLTLQSSQTIQMTPPRLRHLPARPSGHQPWPPLWHQLQPQKPGEGKVCASSQTKGGSQKQKNKQTLLVCYFRRSC